MLQEFQTGSVGGCRPVAFCLGPAEPLRIGHFHANKQATILRNIDLTNFYHLLLSIATKLLHHGLRKR